MKSSDGAILTARPLSGPDAAGATPEVPRIESGACGGSALGPRPSLPPAYTRSGEQVPRAARVGTADRGRRRHGRRARKRRAGPSLPRGGEPAGARERRRRAPRLHPRGRRADRDEHVRREPAEARAALPRGRVRAAVELRREAGARGARGVGARRLHRGLDRPARRRRASGPRAVGAVRRAGADPRGPRRRPLHGRDVLRPRRSRERGRGRPLGVGAPDRRAHDVRQRPADARRRLGPRSSGPARHARRRGVRREPRRRARGGARRDRRHARRGQAARRAAERRPGEHVGAAHRVPARDARVLRAVRSAGARVRRRDHRRLLRHHTRADRCDPRRDRRRRRACGLAAPPRARGRRARVAVRGADAAAAAARRRRVRRLRSARSAARREPGVTARNCARGARVGQGAARRRERQPARTRAHERDHGVRRDRAADRRRDDPAPDAARHDGQRPRVGAARRARGGRAEHPRRHGRSAGGGRLSRARTACTRSTRSASSS